MLTSEEKVRRWEFTPLGGGTGAIPELDARRRKAAEEGREAGYRAGMAAAQAVGARFAALLASGARAARLLEERVAGELLDLAVDLARHVVRADVAVNREAVLPVAREAVALIAQEARAVQVVVHPTDAELMRKHLADEVAQSGWRIVEDHRVEPGGLRLHSAGGDVDATLETRWRRVLSVLGRDHAWHERR